MALPTGISSSGEAIYGGQKSRLQTAADAGVENHLVTDPLGVAGVNAKCAQKSSVDCQGNSGQVGLSNVVSEDRRKAAYSVREYQHSSGRAGRLRAAGRQ